IVNGTTHNAGSTATIAGIGTITISTTGEYTFTPVQDWNGTVPQISYVVTDGTDTRTSTLDIDVLPVNDAPATQDASGHVVEGGVYTFSDSDFVFTDTVEGHGHVSVVINTLPQGGTLQLDGNPVTA